MPMVITQTPEPEVMRPVGKCCIGKFGGFNTSVGMHLRAVTIFGYVYPLNKLAIYDIYRKAGISIV